jgi:broad specificity phosphatase PhoE
MNAPAETVLLLIRHAETDWNRAQRLQGWIDTPLNGRGRRQAREMALWCRERRWLVSQVVCSPLARARQTAASIARAGRLPFTVDPTLMEIDHGAWAGLTVPQIARRFPTAVTGGQIRPEAFESGGGEPLAAAYRRASSALRRLLSVPAARTIVVVGHGVTNALIVCAAVGHPVDQIARYAQSNGQPHLLRFQRRTLVALSCHRSCRW